MHNGFRLEAFRSLGLIALLVLPMLVASPRASAVDKQQRKAKEAEAKRLMGLGRSAEKQGHLIDARLQYLASEHVLYNEDAEKALDHVAEEAADQVKDLMSDAAKAYASESFNKAADLLESAGALHPGDLTIGCNLALTRYQQHNRDAALALLDECVGALRDKETKRQLAELYTALETGDRVTVVPSSNRQRVARLNDAILEATSRDLDHFKDSDGAPPPLPLCTQMKQLQSGLPGNPAMLYNLANCAESEGRAGDAVRFLTDYSERAPDAADVLDVRERLAALKVRIDLPDPSGTLVRTLYASAAIHVDARAYDEAIADYVKADAAAPEFLESKRRIATLLEAQGQVERARTSWQQLAVAATTDDGRRQIQIIVDGLDGEKAQYDELVGAGRQILQDLVGRSVLEGEWVGRIYAAYRLQLANEKIQAAAVLLPLAPEASSLQAFICSQMNDFRCVHASFDSQRSLKLPVSFYGAVFYKGVEPKKRWEKVRTYGKFEFANGTLRFAEISTVDPKKGAATLPTITAGDDRLGRLGAADGLGSSRFQGFTVPVRAITHFETQGGLLYLEVNDKSVKRRQMLIEPIKLVLDVPLEGPGARKYLNNYISIADTYGGVEKAKFGNEHTSTGEAFSMVMNVASIGLDVTSLMFGDFTAVMGISQGVGKFTQKVGVSQQQAQRLAIQQRLIVQGNRFKAIPTEPGRLTFRKDLK